MTYVTPPFLVVPAIPPRPPQLSLVGSAVKADGATDPSNPVPPADLSAQLPPALRQELAERSGPDWVRGFTYAPENHYAVENRDPYDFTSVDAPALPAPSNLALAQSGSGTLANGTYHYQVTAVNPNGETTALAFTSITVSGGGGVASVVLTWEAVADDCTYNVYGRSGTLGKLVNVGPFDPDNPPTYTDTGAATPGVTVPVSNTTGGVGPYTNQATVQVVPWLIVANDYCSSLGFEARDFKGRALRLLENAQYQAIEREFWGGALAQAKGYPNNYLTSASAVDLTPGTVPSVARGQQILQDYLSNTGFGGQGMIHCQPQTAPSLLNSRRVGNLLLDIFDNIIVPGTGYPGTAANIGTPAAGTAVMFATDMVVTRTEPEGQVYPDTFEEALDRGQAGFPNRIDFRAEKYGCAYWDGYVQAGVRVTLAT